MIKINGKAYKLVCKGKTYDTLWKRKIDLNGKHCLIIFGDGLVIWDNVDFGVGEILKEFAYVNSCISAMGEKPLSEDFVYDIHDIVRVIDDYIDFSGIDKLIKFGDLDREFSWLKQHYISYLDYRREQDKKGFRNRLELLRKRLYG